MLKKLAKKLIYSIPNFRAMRDHVEFLEKENDKLLKEDAKLFAKLAEENRKLLEHSTLTNAGNLKLEEEKQFLQYRIIELKRLHNEVVMRNWVKDRARQEFVCLSPFTRVEITATGEVYTCCSAHLMHDFFIGNIFESTIEEMWNGENVKKLRYSVTQGDFEYCNHMCMWLRSKPEELDHEINPLRLRADFGFHYKTYQDCIVSEMPKEISLSCDYSCNLTCPSCRTGLQVMHKDKSDLLYEKLMNSVRPALKGVEHLSALGSGDIFASTAISRFFKTLSKEEFPELRILIITNAQLFTESRWKEFSNLEGMCIDLAISIDAAKKDSYEKIRRGGSWEKLNKNLEYISLLKREGKIHRLALNFLVQKDNCLEIKEFMDFARRWKADIVEFQKMANWGSFDADEYLDKNVLIPENPYYNSVIEVIKDIVKNTKDIKVIENIT